MIRDAEPADIERIFEIEKDNFTRPWTKTSFLNEFKKQNKEFLVYEIYGQIAGYIIFWYILDEAELANVAVAKNCRRQGIAAKLLKYCIKRHPEVSRVYLEVEKTNTGAISLYRKFGFKTTGFIKNYYGNDRDAQRMCLSL